MNPLSGHDLVIACAGSAGRPLYFVSDLVAIKSLGGHLYRIQSGAGEVDIDLRATEGVVLQGPSGNIPVSFLEDAIRHHVAVTFHADGGNAPFMLSVAAPGGRHDLLTRQILKREDQRVRLYVAKQFCVARLESMAWLTPIPKSAIARARQAKTLASVRRVESEADTRYWKAYYANLGIKADDKPEYSPVGMSVNAAVTWIRTVLLGWVFHHRLSPAHGYLHDTFDALVMDLAEPYRALAERAVFDAAVGATSEITPAMAIEATKAALSELVYVPATQQTVEAKHLLIGAVRAMRAYLSGEMLRLTLPIPGDRKPGRPFQTTYRLPGGR